MTYHWPARRAGVPPDSQQNAAMSRVGGGMAPQESRKASVEVTLFDIEKDGDPRISRYMYYDFVVTKNEAYYQLQPGYLPTTNYPRRQKSDPVMIKGEPRYPCRAPCCSAEPFSRHAELERHFKREHEPSRDEYCDYPSCAASSSPPNTNGAPPKKPFRLDTIQEHYRNTHSEDLLRPNYHDDEDYPGKVDRFLATKIGAGLVSLEWWRCGRCKQRVNVPDDDYQCPRCKLLCEPERVAWRRKMMGLSDMGMDGLQGGINGGMGMGMQGRGNLQSAGFGAGGIGMQSSGGMMGGGGMMDVDAYGEDAY